DQEIEEVEHLWEELRHNWKNYLGLPSILVSARRFQARTEEKLADVLTAHASRSKPDQRPALEEKARAARQQAVVFWLDLAKGTNNLQTLAYRHHAQRLDSQ